MELSIRELKQLKLCRREEEAEMEDRKNEIKTLMYVNKCFIASMEKGLVPTSEDIVHYLANSGKILECLYNKIESKENNGK